MAVTARHLKERESIMKTIAAIPVFAYLLIVYNLMILSAGMPELLEKPLMGAGLISGAVWSLNVGHLLLILGVIALFIEIIKSTRTGSVSVVDHMLSTGVFIIFLIEFVTVKGAGNSIFLILALMSLLDVLAGFTITIIASRRDIALGERAI